MSSGMGRQRIPVGPVPWGINIGAVPTLLLPNCVRIEAVVSDALNKAKQSLCRLTNLRKAGSRLRPNRIAVVRTVEPGQLGYDATQRE